MKSAKQKKESGWGKGRARAYWLAMGLFVLFFSALLAVMAPDFRGQPIYPNLTVVQDAPTDEVAAFFEGEPFVFEFDARQANYDEIYWLNLLSAHGEEIEVVVENLTQVRQVAKVVTETGENTRFEPDNEAGDRMRISMRWLRPPAPKLWLSTSVAPPGVTLEVDGEERSAAPLFYCGRKDDPKSDWDRSLLLYPEEQFTGEPEDLLVFENRDTVTIRFDAPVDDLNFLKIPGLVEHPKTRVKIVIRNETTGEVIKNSMAEDGEDYERRFDGANRKGDRIAIDLLWRLPLDPTVQRVMYDAEPPIVTRIGGEEVDFPLAFLLRSPWPTIHLHWLWLVVLAGFFYVWFTKTRAFGYLVLLGVACSASSILVWQQNYSHDYPHVDPDGYGLYGEQIAHYLTGEQDRGDLRDNMRDYSHSHVALTPFFIAIGVLCGLPTTVAYLVVANLASFGNLLLLWRLLTRKFGMEMRAALMVVSFYATHLFVLKSFGRASTDALGELLVVTMLYLLADRLRRVTVRQSVLISVIVLLQVLARPPGVVLGPFMIGMTLLCDVYREQKLGLGRRIMTGLKLGLGPLLFIVICYVSFDWLYNQELALEKSKRFRPFSTPLMFWYCMPPLLQLFPIFWLGLASEKWRKYLPEMAVFAVWGIFYCVLLIAVQAPFLLRLFLPVVPAVILLAAPGCGWLEARNRPLAMVVTLVLCAINVAIQIYNSTIEYLPPVIYLNDFRFEISRFIY